MSPKELCEACRHITREIAAIEQQINRIGSIGGPRKTTSSLITGMPAGTNRPDVAQNQQVEAYEQLLIEKQRQAIELLMLFEGLLSQIQDSTDRAILRYYYGSGWTDEKIAEEMDLSDRTVRGRRKNSLLNAKCV